ncbi:DNA helicase RecQ [Treponema denticola]|uniref:DNA helicase RecQ n=1 Tax=Treponema denticola TaxID=158 RepID=UPI0021069657|nr:DNA helicase RecQ [Treponema denticola]UTY22749.1 DNA helicase RecQ [Treponema denticola]
MTHGSKGSDNSKLSSTSEEILKNVFGYDEFRLFQKEIIDCVLQRKDTLAVLPTGGGKSLCYQVPALIFEGLTVVVSPLISLMHDQICGLETVGIKAAALNSSLDWEKYADNIRRIKNGEVKILYVSPETLASDRCKELLSSIKVDCITIDEAHCISEWGHDFRPEYRQLAGIRKLIPDAVCLALTATATEKVRSDIKKMLKLKSAKEFVASFNRKNIFLEVKENQKPFEQASDFLKDHKGESGIIYCFSRKQADTLSVQLSVLGYNAKPYHAGLSDELRQKTQNDFINDDIEIIVATVAFGMGINKPNVRFVIHFDLPKSIEQYYQEIGRAGRDGKPAHALLLFSGADIFKLKFLMQDKAPDEVKKAEAMLSAISNYAQANSCRRRAILKYFGENISEGKLKEIQGESPCCDFCSREKIEKTDLTVPVQKFLSCVIRTGCRFGASYIIDVLLGSKQKRILENKHNDLSVWGIGTEFNREGWFNLVRILLAEDYLVKDEDYSVLSLTQKAKEELQSRTAIFLPFDYEKENSDKQDIKEKIKPPPSDDTLDPVGTAIVKSLNQKRRDLADEARVPAYVIFSDKTIFDLGVKKPSSIEELDNIFGIGKAKKEKYGEMIIQLVTSNNK